MHRFPAPDDSETPDPGVRVAPRSPRRLWPWALPLLLAPLLLPLLLLSEGRSAVLDAVLRTLLYPAPSVHVPEPPGDLREVVLQPSADASVAGSTTDRDSGPALVAWERLAAGAPDRRPAALFFHGNGENLETMRRAGLFLRLDELDVPYLAVDYPGYGRSLGTPSEASLLAGAEAALRHLRSVHPERPVVVVGWSLGAAVTVQLAAKHQREVAAVGLFSPWTTLSDVAARHFPALLVRPATAGRWDSLAAVAGVALPALVVHGRDDRIIPFEQGERVAGTLAGDVRWLPVVDAGHNDLLGHEEVWRELAALLDRVEREGSPAAAAPAAPATPPAAPPADPAG